MFLLVAMQAAGKQANMAQQNWLAVDSSLHKFF